MTVVGVKAIEDFCSRAEEGDGPVGGPKVACLLTLGIGMMVACFHIEVKSADHKDRV